jgi:predicted transcriptional regulator
MSHQYTGPMEVNLSPDLEGKLAQAAGRRGVSADALIREAIERVVDYDDWFIREVEKGLTQIDAGQVLTHDAVGARLEQKLAEHQSRR